MTQEIQDKQKEQETAELNRLYWHSRRGMWELDLLLIPFLDTRYLQLSPELQANYQQLITLEDQDLFGWLMRREEVSDPSLKPIVEEIINFAQTTSVDKFKNL